MIDAPTQRCDCRCIPMPAAATQKSPYNLVRDRNHYPQEVCTQEGMMDGGARERQGLHIATML